jgi:DNA-binding LacI/PurR family transcriptional regulator
MIESIRTRAGRDAAVVTITDVARHAGVAPSTVSYVLTGKRSISEQTRERVALSIEALGYRPHAGARALRSSRTGIIGLVMPFRSDGYDQEATGPLHEPMTVVEGVLQAAHDHEMNVLLLTADRGTAEIDRVVSSSMVDGLILTKIGLHDVRVPFIEHLACAAVLIGKPDDPTELPFVEFDFEEAGRLCAEHLFELGHRSIGFVGRPPIAYERQEGFAIRARRGATDALREHGLELHSTESARTLEGVDRALSQLFGAREAPTALIVHSGIALTFLPQALQRIGHTLGGDVSVVAICADEHALSVSPPVSSVGVPEYALGTDAVELLVARLKDKAVSGETWLTPVLTTRGRDPFASPAGVSLGGGQGT